MLHRLILVLVFSILITPFAEAQDPAGADRPGWRTPGNETPRVAANPGQEPLRGVPSGERQTIARVTKGAGSLPNEHGQVWREYDISPYTLRVTTTNQPEQAIVDWILRETGYETWHSEPLGLLSANSRTLRVYHVPEIQSIVAEIVDRFVNTEAETQAFGLRIVTVGNPNWRAQALRLMKSVPVQSQGVQGWLMAKEDAALMLAEMSRRTDFREHSSPNLLVNNGQSVVISTLRNRAYVKGVLPSQGNWQGFEPEMGQLEEGFSLEFNPLLGLDGRTVDAVVKLQLNQIEKMVPVMLDMPIATAPAQRMRVEVPQMTSSNLHERFRWPTDQVLLLSMGVVATPNPGGSGNPLTQAAQVLPLPLPKAPGRADALLFVECKGKLNGTTLAPGTALRNSGNYPGRY
ncbi:MAG: hypothetical protein KDA42_13345 [Planctomycetales bacterium]|nr:hypothetical protein [Planctomycetales bacterium]